MVPRFVFVTSSGHDGNFAAEAGAVDGLDGADIFCQGKADGVNAIVPVGTYKAWLSDSTADAKDRIGITFFEYFLSDGTIIATGLVDLIDGTALDSAIALDETGTAVGALAVWTGTSTAGVGVLDDCTDWTTTGDIGQFGTANVSATPGWTDSGKIACTTPARLYCFQVLGGD